MSVEKYEDRIARENAEKVQVQTDFNTKLAGLKIPGWELVPHISGTMSIKHHITGACIFFTQTAWAIAYVERLNRTCSSHDNITYYNRGSADCACKENSCG